MTELFPVAEEWAARSHCDAAKYKAMYQRSVDDPDGFWAEQSRRLHWFTPPTRIKNTSFTGDVAIRWFEDGVLNVSFNCIDRHLPHRGNQVAIIHEGDDPTFHRNVTYRELHDRV